MNKHAKLAILIVAVTIGMAYAAGRGNVFVQRVSRNDGNKITPIYVSCSSTTWTSILAVNKIRRVAKLVTLSDSNSVCLSTNTGTAYVCDTTRPGYILVGGGTYEHASEAYVACRSSDNASAAIVRGLEYTDLGDNESAE